MEKSTTKELKNSRKALQPQNGPSSRMMQILRDDIRGLKNVEIAEKHNITPQTVSNVKGADLYKAKKKEMQEEINEETVKRESTDPTREFLKSQSLPAAKKVAHIMENGESEKNQMHSAFDLLDRAGYGKKQDIGNAVQVNIADDDFEVIADTLKMILPENEREDVDLEELV